MQLRSFPTDYDEILSRVDQVNPADYGKTRNYLNGTVTRLSPYISRGVISTRTVLERVLSNGFSLEDSEKLIQELAWREYFQRVWQQLEDDLFDDIRRRHTGTRHRQLPDAMEQAATGIQQIDAAIQELKETGYIHNHLRMYIASITCNVGKAWWKAPSEWMYYHLLDGDIASNTCSWQWVAGQFSSKQYWCNQENINKYSGVQQSGTFLDKPYEELPVMPIPDVLNGTIDPERKTELPKTPLPTLNNEWPLLLYTSYNLDPEWHRDMQANRVLVLEPSHFREFPVSEKVIRFILDLVRNIEGLQVWCGEVQEIPGLHRLPAIYSKEHPAFRHFPGIKEEREWLFPDTSGFYPSFFSFWKQAKQGLWRKERKRLSLQRA